MRAFAREREHDEDARVPGRSAGAPVKTPGKTTLVAAEGISAASEPLPFFAQIQRAFGRVHDLSSIRTATGGAAAALGAEAFATRNRIAFRAAPSLHTAAHEAAHVVMQRAGIEPADGIGAADDEHERHADRVADRVVAGQSAAELLPAVAGTRESSAVQLRRVPAETAAQLGGANATAQTRGAQRVIEQAEAELTVAQRAAVQAHMLGGQTQPEFDALPEPTRLARHIDAIRTVAPDTILGDPRRIDERPAHGSADAANVRRLVVNANAVFDAVAGNAHDTDIDQVFGHPHRGAAKLRFHRGKTGMHHLLARNRIVTDRSGYDHESGQGGLTSFDEQIALEPEAFDHPDAHGNVSTMVHEAMHAGNAEVTDRGYLGSPSFVHLSAHEKLTNAAHYEVVARRHLGMANGSYAGVVFTPAGQGPQPALTPMQIAVRDASEQFRLAWNACLGLHSEFDRLFKNQRLWRQAQDGGTFAGGLPFWSKVERMTIHLKTNLDPASADPARRPISELDMAISEGVTRRLDQGRAHMELVPPDDAAATHLLETHTSAGAVAGGLLIPMVLRDLWIRAVLRRIGAVTGSEERDLRVVTELAHLQLHWETLLRHRSLSSFPD
ncbi:MAG TPA: DUF4157 domain-containing protein [Kofleriaceae bacterium]|jgi:hypothetical protein